MGTAVRVVDMLSSYDNEGADGVAHIHEELADAALRMMERNMRAEPMACEDCRLEG